MAINKGIIQVRRGLKEDLQSDKLLPGELAIATDAPCMWFCWSPGNVEQLPTSDNVIDVIIETVNQYLANNDITVISDGFMRVYDGWIQYSADNKTWKNVIAVSELIGENGGYYTPAVTDNGDLTWTPSSAGMESLPSVNIRGPEAALTKESVENALGYAPLKSADVVDNLVSTATNLPLSAKQGNVLDEKISELNKNNTWKIHKTYLEGKHSVTLPTVFSELHIIVYSVNSREITYSFSFIAQELTTNGRSYSNGYGWHIATNSNVCQIQISQTNVYVKALYNGGENILDDAIMDIYYK